MRELQAPIAQVTLLEDRALVRRLAELDLPQGVSRWRLRKVPLILVDKTLCAQIEGAGRLIHLTLDRRQPPPVPPLPPAPDPDDQVSQRRRKELAEKQTLLERELSSVSALQQELLQDMSQQVAWGNCCAEDWEQRIRELADWKEELLKQRHDLVIQSEALVVPPRPWTPVDLDEPDVVAEVVLELEAAQAGRASLCLEYVVPCACWRPYHRAVLDGNELEFFSEACCWQNTGEDWNEVELAFSTQRPSLGTEPPRLSIETLRSQKKSQEVVVAQRDQEVHQLESTLPGPSRVRSNELPGIDDQGQSVHLKAPLKATVLSHGKPVRIPLFSFTSPAELENLLMAEVCSEPVQKSRHLNQSPLPLLAGPVDLVRQAGLIGRTSLLYVAPGEKFSLGWGPQSNLRATRTVVTGQEEKDDLMGGWFKSVVRVELTLSNLSAETQSLKVVERIPVSEIKEVEVVFDAKTTSLGAKPDSNGFVTWEVEVAPRGRYHLKLSYAVRRGKQVITA